MKIMGYAMHQLWVAQCCMQSTDMIQIISPCGSGLVPATQCTCAHAW